MGKYGLYKNKKLKGGRMVDMGKRGGEILNKRKIKLRDKIF